MRIATWAVAWHCFIRIDNDRYTDKYVVLHTVFLHAAILLPTIVIHTVNLRRSPHRHSPHNVVPTGGGLAGKQGWEEGRRFGGKLVVEKKEEALRTAKEWDRPDTL